MMALAIVEQPGELAPENRLLENIERAREHLREASTLGEARKVEGFMRAALEWARRQEVISLAACNEAKLLWLDAQAKQGEMLEQMERQGKGRPEKPGFNPDFSPALPTLRELGYRHDDARRYRSIASVPPEVRIRVNAEVTAQGLKLTQKALLDKAKQLKNGADAEPIEDEAEPERAACPDWIPAAFQNQITVGDARELSACLPDESISLCYCDPIYNQVDDYRWLARECERVLMPGGSLIVQSGNSRRYECETAIRQTSLEFVDLLAEMYPYGIGRLFKAKTFVGWKPYLWFSKGPRTTGWVVNRWHAGGKTKASDSKEIHPWGDSEEFASRFLAELCDENSVLWDPFAGSGVVPVVAARLGIPFVAFEIEPSIAERARQRLRGTSRDSSPQIGMEFEEEP